MGNCLISNTIPTQNEANQVIKETGKITASNLEGAAEFADGVKLKKKKKKKVVRFKLNEENNVDRSGKQGRESRNGVVRIRLVVTQKELKQILSSRKDLKQSSSMEQLIRVVKLRGARISEAGRRTSDDDDEDEDEDEDGFHGAWRPALESIPEEH